MSTSERVLRNAILYDTEHDEPRRVDIGVVGSKVTGVERVGTIDADTIIECDGRVALPGFVDTHSHADAQVFEPEVQKALLRQGVTTIVGGQDGVSYAPGDGSYASTYYRSLDGLHPTYHGETVADLLSTYDRSTPINVAYLVPAGTVRHIVVGSEDTPADAQQLQRMKELLRAGLRDGAVGLSTGLDYVPGAYAPTSELIALNTVVAASDALYVTHMRGGYESNIRVGIEEVAAIVSGSGVQAHISHLHGPIDLVLATLDEFQMHGVPLTFDAYPYSRGCTLLSMLMLPSHLAAPDSDHLARAVATPAGRDHVLSQMRERVVGRADLGEDWADQIMLSFIADDRYCHIQGLTLEAAATSTGCDPLTLALDVLVGSRQHVSAIMRVPIPRSVAEYARLFSHAGHMIGTDGIYIGPHPHPRAYGTYPRFLAEFVNKGYFSWTDVAEHLSSRACSRFRLGARGSIAPGRIADIVLVDPEHVMSPATYENPKQFGIGIDDVFVAGEQVLRDGELTGICAGEGIRRA